MKFKKTKSSIKENIILKQKWYWYLYLIVSAVAIFLIFYWFKNKVIGYPEDYYDKKASKLSVVFMCIIPPAFLLMILRGCFQYYIFTEVGIYRIRFNMKKNSRLYSWRELSVTLPKTVKMPDYINAYRGGLFISTKKITPFEFFGFGFYSFCELNKFQTNHLEAAKLMVKNGNANLSNESLKKLQGYIEYYDKNSRI